MQVNIYSALRNFMGEKSLEVELEGTNTVKELIDGIVNSYPVLESKLLDENAQLFTHIHVYVNGRDTLYLRQGTGTQVNIQDKVDIFPHGYF